jgi:hypothetical protein
MAVRGITIRTTGVPVASDPVRLDAALAVGLATPRAGELPAGLLRWLAATGRGESMRAGRRVAIVSGADLVGVPIPVASYEMFAALFETTRPVADAGSDRGRLAIVPLAAAARAFFAHGGANLTVVALGAPPSAGAGEPERIQALERLLFGTALWTHATRRVQLLTTWLPPIRTDVAHPSHLHGVAWLDALEEPAMLLLPDLPELTAAPARSLEAGPYVLGDPSATLCCAPAPSAQYTPLVAEPRHDEQGFALWVRLASHVAAWARSRRRTAQCVFAAPLAQKQLASAGDPWRYRRDLGLGDGDGDGDGRDLDAGGLASSFVVLAGGWISGPLATESPGGWLPGDAVVAGLLAANARERGSFRAAIGAVVHGNAVEPLDGRGARDTLAERLCLIEPTPRGLRLGSDVTTSAAGEWRPGPTSRLLSLVVRAARGIGEELVFEPSGEGTWRRLRRRLDDLLARLTARGALAPSRDEPAYSVTCDRTTMTQADLDAGRLVARIQLRPTAPVAAIELTLASDGVALVPTGGPA